MLIVISAAARAARARNSGHRMSRPTPLRNVPRMTTR
jgi:hypothetical protein